VIADVRANVRAIFRASHDAVQFTNRSEDYGRARLQGDNSSRGVVNEHDKQSYRPLDSMRVARKETSQGKSRPRHGTILGMYSRELLDHFEHPRNAGEVTNADATVQVENPACGDILKLSLKLAEGRVAEIRFLAKGCVPAMACGSALTELVRGKTIEAAAGLRREELVQAVGGLPETSIHASHLAMDALGAALKQAKI
jgi:nitrogen fixation NifU-like protein